MGIKMGLKNSNALITTRFRRFVLRPCTVVRKKEGAYDKNSQDKNFPTNTY